MGSLASFLPFLTLGPSSVNEGTNIVYPQRGGER